MNLYELLKPLIPSLKWLEDNLVNLFPPAAYDEDPRNLPMNQPPYRWDTPQNARHSVRVLCDEVGLTLHDKNVITACVQQESGFMNRRPDGTPMKNINYYKNKNGVYYLDTDGNKIVASTDWGICQINDHYHVGKGKRWSSVASIVDNPDKAIKWMITMYKQGHLNQWVSYSSGAYLKYMPK